MQQFPFLIGKVLTEAYVVYKGINTFISGGAQGFEFPFLIGKVLTQRIIASILLIAIIVSIPYR